MQKISEPPKEELEDLLFNQMLSKKKVAKYYGVCIRVVRRWMNLYDLVNKTPVELQQRKREITRSLKQTAWQGGTIVKPGFNSEFIEEYAMEREAEKIRRQENYQKRQELEKLKRHKRTK